MKKMTMMLGVPSFVECDEFGMALPGAIMETGSFYLDGDDVPKFISDAEMSRRKQATQTAEPASQPAGEEKQEQTLPPDAPAPSQSAQPTPDGSLTAERTQDQDGAT